VLKMKKSRILLVFLAGLIVLVGTVGKHFAELSSNRSKQVAEAVESDIKSDLGESNTVNYYTLDVGKQIPVMQAMGSFRGVESFKELVDSSDVVVVGRPLLSLEESEVRLSILEETNTITGIFSTTPFSIETVLKGSFRSGEKIIFSQSLAILSRAEMPIPKDLANRMPPLTNPDEVFLLSYSREEYRPVKVGSSYLLFLRRGSVAGSDVYFPVGDTFGRVNVDGTDELSLREPVENKIEQYAKRAFREAQRNPNSNALATVINESEGDFPAIPEDPNLERGPENIPNVGVVAPREITRNLPPLSRRNPRSLENPGSTRRRQP
jgi:hypothetical protein